jgi:hypothetical protein
MIYPAEGEPARMWRPYKCPARGRKVMSPVYAMWLGADSIDDCDSAALGAPSAPLGPGAAPSTRRTFSARLTFGHVRQLDRLLAEMLTRAWQGGAAPATGG